MSSCSNRARSTAQISPSGLIYRYVLESPDRSPMELKTIEDWVVERAFKAVPGVADDSGLGGVVMQYQLLLDPASFLLQGSQIRGAGRVLGQEGGITG